MLLKVKVKWSRYRPGVAQRVGIGIALLFHDRCTRRVWVVSSTPRPHFTPGKDPVPILQGAGWAPGPVWTGGKSRPHRDSIPDRPTLRQSLYRLSYPAHDTMLLLDVNAPVHCEGLSRPNCWQVIILVMSIGSIHKEDFWHPVNQLHNDILNQCDFMFTSYQIAQPSSQHLCSVLQLPAPCITFVLAIFFKQPFNELFCKLSWSWICLFPSRCNGMEMYTTRCVHVTNLLNCTVFTQHTNNSCKSTTG